MEEKLPLIVVRDKELDDGRLREVEINNLLTFKTAENIHSMDGSVAICAYHDGINNFDPSLEGRAIYLSKDYKWTIGLDSNGFRILIAELDN